MDKVFKWFVLLCSTLVFFAPAAAAYEADSNDTTLSPYFFVENGDPSVDQFPLKQTEVDVNISGVIGLTPAQISVLKALGAVEDE